MDLNDFFGAAVQLAKRICDFAEQDTVMVSGIIKDLCLGKGIHFESVGNQNFKGFSDSFQVFRAEVVY
jgi:class 3 adenylate cyclase